MRTGYNILFGKSEGNAYLGGLHFDGKMIIKWTLKHRM
jgi:hypothetical protein